MLEKLQKVLDEFNSLEEQMSDPNVISNITEYKKVSSKYSHLKKKVKVIEEYKNICENISSCEAELESEKDSEIIEMIKEELSKFKSQKELSEENVKTSLIPEDPNDGKNAIIEIRPGAGGDESSLFAEELFRMYSKYAVKKNWTVEIVSIQQSSVKGFKEVIFQINGDRIFSQMKFESGVHRVQRIPSTESQGRVHTSTVTVAVLPEAEEVDIEIKAQDVRIDVFRSSGPGGQSVNTTDSAVRITHIATNLVVICQDGKSQLKNKEKAMKVLRSRLYSAEQDRLAKERGDARKGQIGTGDRSEKIRTYNFPQDRLTDHRMKTNWSNLPKIMEGEIDDVIEKLIIFEQTEKLKEL